MLVVVMIAADQSFHKFLWCIPSYLKENVSCFIFHAEQLMRKKCWFTVKTWKLGKDTLLYLFQFTKLRFHTRF